MTHGPPKNILDANKQGEPCGCEWLAYEVANRIKPKVHVFGHIHESFGHEERNGVHYYNVSHLNERYRPENKPVIIDL